MYRVKKIRPKRTKALSVSRLPEMEKGDSQAAVAITYLEYIARTYLALGEELVRGGEVPEVRLEAEGELEEEGPLGLHGGQHGLHHLRGRVVRDDERLAPVHHRGELALAALQLTHQPLVVLLHLKEGFSWKIVCGTRVIAVAVFSLIPPNCDQIVSDFTTSYYIVNELSYRWN